MSSVLPWSRKAAVVPEKYKSASCAAHPGNQSGSFSAGRRGAGSGVMPQHLSQIRFENRRRFVELLGHAGEVLQLGDRLFSLPHALGRRIDLAAEEIRILPV